MAQPPEGKDLSRGGAGREEPVFRYNRERRLSRAPSGVLWLESRRGARRSGNLFSSLFATRSSRILFAVIIGVILFYLGLPLFQADDRAETRLAGASWTLSASWSGAQLLVELERRGGEELAGSILSLALSLPGAESSLREFVLAGGERERLRFSVPATDKPRSIALLLLLKGEGASLSTRLR
jgi:hypothetical protein